MAVAALLALGMLAIIPGMIAGSALTESAKQVPNVVTQVAGAVCAYQSGWLNDPIKFGVCMAAATLPAGYAAGRVFNMAKDQVREGERLFLSGTSLSSETLIQIGVSLLRSGATLVRFTPWGFVAYTL